MIGTYKILELLWMDPGIQVWKIWGITRETNQSPTYGDFYGMQTCCIFFSCIYFVVKYRKSPRTASIWKSEIFTVHSSKGAIRWNIFKMAPVFVLPETGINLIISNSTTMFLVKTIHYKIFIISLWKASILINFSYYFHIFLYRLVTK